MKKLTHFTIAFLVLGFFQANAQEQKKSTAPVKANQATLVNDFYISYGFGSLYFISNQGGGSNSYKTSGAVILGYSRSLSMVVAVGFQASFMNISHKSGSSTYEDNYWSGLANVRFRYYNRPSFCMYSGVALGIAMDYINENKTSGTNSYQNYYPAGQLTLLGFRVGRSLSFFGEFGIGTNSIINGGISYKFGE